MENLTSLGRYPRCFNVFIGFCHRQMVLDGTIHSSSVEGMILSIVCSNNSVRSRYAHPCTTGPKALSAPSGQTDAIVLYNVSREE